MKINLKNDLHNEEEIKNLKEISGVNFFLHESQGIDKIELAPLFF